MKNTIAILAITTSLLSCSKDDDNDIKTGISAEYKLIEVLADPGDGSGTFEPVESDKTIQFYNDATVTSNGELCYMSIESDSATSGTYSFSDSTINSSGCDKLKFEIQGSELIINYPCIEPCRAKFVKL